MRDRGDREGWYYWKIQEDMYVIHEVEFFLLMTDFKDKLTKTYRSHRQVSNSQIVP